MIPPVFINLRMSWIWIPIPVVLFWPLLLILWVILGLGLTVALLGTGGRAKDAGIIWIEVWRLLCASRGVSIDIDQTDVRVTVSII